MGPRHSMPSRRFLPKIPKTSFLVRKAAREIKPAVKIPKTKELLILNHRLKKLDREINNLRYEPKEISKLRFETSETLSVSERLRNGKAISKSLSNLKKFDKKFLRKGTHIHPSAVVSDKARIGKGTRVWCFAQIRENAVIGKNCNIGNGSKK